MAKSGTSIYMDRDVLRWIDERVKERVFASRSHAFEYAVVQIMKTDRQKRRGYQNLTGPDIKHINRRPRVSGDKKW